MSDPTESARLSQATRQQVAAGAVRVVDNETGQLVDVSTEEAQAGFLDGRFGLDASQRVRVRLEDGRVGSIDPAEAQDVIGAGGSFLSEEQFDTERDPTLGETAQAFVQGAGRGLTFGATDVGLARMREDALTEGELEGENQRIETMQANEARAPGASLAGEIVGSALPMFLGGGAGLAARGGLEAAAAGAERLTAEQLATRTASEAGQSLAQSLGRTALHEGLQGAAEGSVYGLNQSIAESSLGDHELTAERLLANVGMSAFFGGAAGGVFGVGSRLASHGAEAATKTMVQAVRGAVGDDAIRSFAERSAFKAAGGMLSDFRRAEQRAGGVRQIGRDALDEGVVTMTSTLDEIAEKAAQRTEHHGQRIGQMIERLDASNTGIRPTGDDVAAIVREVVSPLQKGDLATHTAVARRVQGEIEPFLQKYAWHIDADGVPVPGQEMSFGQLHEFRKDLDDVIYRYKGPDPPEHIKELRSLRGKIEGYLESKGDEAAATLGEQFASDYKNAKRLYGSMKTIRDIAQDRLLREDANRFFSPSDYGIGSVGAILTGAGVDPGSIAMGVVTGSIHKVIRERGRAFVAGALDKVSRLNVLQNSAAKAERRMARSLEGFFQNAGRATKRAGRTATARYAIDSFEERAKELRNDSSEAQIDRVARATNGFHDAAPNTSIALGSTYARAQAFLRSKLPPGLQPTDGLQPHLARSRVSDSEKASFLRYARAVEHPMSLLDDLEEGRITREAVEAVRTVYPRLFEDIQQRVMTELVEAKEPVPFDARIQLGTLLDIPADPSLRPERFAILQQTFSSTSSAQPPSSAASPQLQSLEVSGGALSETQRLEQRRA